jgi:serine/threonine protein kinase
MRVEAIGESIARRYRIIEKLGSGGMGSVYKALDTRLQRLVALKVLHFVDNPEAKPLFLREADALARLNHPNIVQIYDVGETEVLVYVAFEYIEGRTLGQIMADTKPLNPDYALEIVSQVGMALSYAHQRGVIHRDVKPSNILISNNGHVLLLDFGLATAPRSSTLTRTGTIVGTPAYMSPEQAVGHRIDGRSDIFSLGVLLYELLTGARPFDGSSTVELFRRLCDEAPAAPQEINPSVSTSIAAVVLKSLAKQPEQRFQTVDEFLIALFEANPRLAFSLSRLRSQERDAKARFSDIFGGRSDGAPSTMQGTPLERRDKRLLGHPAVERRLRLRVLAALAISAVLLLGIGFLLFGNYPKSLSAGPGSSSMARGSWFRDYGLGLLAVAGTALGFVWRLYAARTGPSQEKVVVVPSPSGAPSDLEVTVQTDPVRKSRLEQLILQGGAGDSDTITTRVSPYRPAPSSGRGQSQSLMLRGRELTRYPSAIAWLRVQEGGNPEREFRLAGKVTIGRQVDSEIVIADPTVSRRHACISLENERFYITDLGSSDGTFVNRERIQKHQLSDRDEIAVGGALLVFSQSLIPGALAEAQGVTPGVLAEANRLGVSPGILAEARRLQEFNAIWDQLTSSARHA